MIAQLQADIFIHFNSTDDTKHALNLLFQPFENRLPTWSGICDIDWLFKNLKSLDSLVSSSFIS